MYSDMIDTCPKYVQVVVENVYAKSYGDNTKDSFDKNKTQITRLKSKNVIITKMDVFTHPVSSMASACYGVIIYG